MSAKPTTAVVVEKLNTAAKDLRALVDGTDMKFDLASRFSTLEAGKFDSAQWIEAMVKDRLKGIDEHGNAMKKAVDDLATKLEEIAKVFKDQDDAMADGLQTQAYDLVNKWGDGTGDYRPAKAEEGTYDTYDNNPNVNRDTKFEIDSSGGAKYDQDGNLKINMTDEERLVIKDGKVVIDEAYSGKGNSEYDGGFLGKDGKDQKGKFDFTINKNDPEN